VTSRGAHDRFRIRKGSARGVTAVTLMSDGAAESLFIRQQQKVAPAIGKMWDWLDTRPQQEALDLLEQSLGGPIRSRTSDDCSLAVMCLPSPSRAALRRSAVRSEAASTFRIVGGSQLAVTARQNKEA
jgi:hypothetical protein